MTAPESAATDTGLARKLGLFDATMIVMGGIIGSGIFMNPYVVAGQVHSPFLILGAWFVGGLVALGGAFIYAELAERIPRVGGQYAYIKEAYHPAVAFVYGWGLLLVTQTGGMAAVAVTFSRYFVELTGITAPDSAVASVVLVILTVINCFGVRAGGTAQNILMILKLGAITILLVVGFSAISANHFDAPLLDRPLSGNLLNSFAAAMVPVLFAFGGWQTASFIAGEMKNPRKDLPRGILMGVCGVIVVYLAVNVVCVGVLGSDGLAASPTPASEVMRRALGNTGSTIIAVGITISTLGFLSQSILTAPRVYFAMANDKVFFRQVAWVHPRTRVPVVAIALQGILAIIIALSGRYEQILNYVVSSDFIFFGMTASTIFIFRKRASRPGGVDASAYRIPGHPFTTWFFVLASAAIVLNTIYTFPVNSLIGIGIVLSGIPVYFIWSGKEQRRSR